MGGKYNVTRRSKSCCSNSILIQRYNNIQVLLLLSLEQFLKKQTAFLVEGIVGHNFRILFFPTIFFSQIIACVRVFLFL